MIIVCKTDLEPRRPVDCPIFSSRLLSFPLGLPGLVIIWFNSIMWITTIYDVDDSIIISTWHIIMMINHDQCWKGSSVLLRGKFNKSSRPQLRRSLSAGWIFPVNIFTKLLSWTNCLWWKETANEAWWPHNIWFCISICASSSLHCCTFKLSLCINQS